MPSWFNTRPAQQLPAPNSRTRCPGRNCPSRRILDRFASIVGDSSTLANGLERWKLGSEIVAKYRSAASSSSSCVSDFMSTLTSITTLPPCSGPHRIDDDSAIAATWIEAVHDRRPDVRIRPSGLMEL